MLAPGTRIDDRYQIIDILGSGGMGQVYRARRIRLGDEVAIKVMQTAQTAPPESRERFLRESRDPGLLQVRDFGEDDQSVFLVTDFIDAVLPYVAPEVMMGGAPDVPADMFTVGMLAYEMVTGRQPFRAASLPELLGQMLQVRPEPPVSLVPDLPVAVSDAILRAIAGAPANRFASADELAHVFRAHAS